MCGKCLPLFVDYSDYSSKHCLVYNFLKSEERVQQKNRNKSANYVKTRNILKSRYLSSQFLK